MHMLACTLMWVLCVLKSVEASTLSSKTACTKLKGLVALTYAAPHGPSEYHCELDNSEGSGRYYVFGLYSNYPAPPNAGPDWVGSSIVGWFAVSKSTGKVFNWDNPDLGLGQEFPAPGDQR